MTYAEYVKENLNDTVKAKAVIGRINSAGFTAQQKVQFLHSPISDNNIRNLEYDLAHFISNRL